jgi:polysaccharide export outer membrane protein
MFSSGIVPTLLLWGAGAIATTSEALPTNRFTISSAPLLTDAPATTQEAGTAGENPDDQLLLPLPPPDVPSDNASPAEPLEEPGTEDRDDFAPSPLRPNPDYTAPLPPRDPSSVPVPTLPPVERSPYPGNFPAPSFETYRLGPGDSIFVNVRRFPDLSFQATLDLQGNIIVPLHGVLSLEGRTLDESSRLIQGIYNDYVVNPEVSLTLIAQRGVEVTILGEVVRPGFYPLSAPQITAALLSAGGTTGFADLRTIRIQRPLANGEVLEETIDLFTPLKLGEELPNIALQDGDVVLVSRLDPAALDEYDRDLVARSTLAQATITVRFLNYGTGSLGSSTAGRLTAIDLPNGSRFADALVRASLNPDTSDLSQVALIRYDEESGQAVTTTLDGRDAFEGVPSENLPLQDNDVIIVNRTLLAKITYGLNTFTQPFRDVLGFLLFFDQLAESADSLFGP